jgi:anti-sigma-K factor RskA
MNAAIHTLAGAYALDALSADEAAYFEQHLDACDGCAQEVAELQATVATMGSTAAEAPPAHLRARVLSAAGEHPQLPPLTATDTVTTPISQARSYRSRRWLTAAAGMLGAAAAVIALAIAVGVGPFDDQQSDQVATTAIERKVAQVIDSPDARSRAARIRGGGELTVISSPSLGETAVVLDQLPKLDAAHDYQMWLLNDRGAKPIAVVPDEAEPEMLLDRVRPGLKIAITREPAGGSAQPTMEPLAYVTTA